jgi:hypothetical protein
MISPDHVDIETVLQRDLARKKPFTDTGKGFRDALVWETAKQVVMESGAGGKIFLVTSNSTGYCGKAGALAPGLCASASSEVRGAWTAAPGEDRPGFWATWVSSARISVSVS